MTTFIKGDPDAPVPDDGTTVVYDEAKGAYVPGPVPGSGTSGPGVDIQVGGSQPASGWWLDNGQPLPDGTAPSTPTGLTATATGGSTVNLSWNASTDNIGVTGYHYRIGTGAAVDAGAGTTETVTGLSPLTAYSFQVQAYDAQGNVSGWSTAANATTLAGPDLTPPTPGTLAASAITQSTFTLTVTGASDAVGLHATPYAFSTDNGATWSAWQAGATYNVTGRTASTGYQAQHKVRDAAGNEATGTAITVTTTAPTPLVADDFNRADTTDSLGTTSTGSKTWTAMGAAGWRILGNQAAPKDNLPYVTYLEGVTPTADMRVTAVVGFKNGTPTSNDRMTLAMRHDGATNAFHYRLETRAIDGTTAKVLVIPWGVTPNTLTGSGSHTALDLGRALAENETFLLDASFKEEGGGTRLVIKFDGTVALDYLHTATTRPQGTGIALLNTWAKARVDDLTVYPA